MSALFDALAGLTLLDPWLLLLALAVPVALGVRRWRGAPAVRFAPAAFTGVEAATDPGPAARPAGHPSARSWFRGWPRGLQVLGVLLAIVALARPVILERVPGRTEGIDIILCLDVSSSMTARDLDPARSRLDVAKDAAARFVAGRPDDRIGLMCFARYPDLRCPLTLDHRALAEFVAGVSQVEKDGPEDATGIGTAVARAVQVLRSSAAKSKVVILLTDGEENVSTVETPEEIAPVHAAQLAAELGVRVYTIVAGIGNPGPAGGFVPLDPTQVRRVATKTGGRFYEARDAAMVAGVYAAINELERVAFAKPRFEVREEFLPFLVAALALLLAGRLLEATVLEVLP